MSSVYKVFCESVGRTDDLYVGSIKPNVGHLEASSGIAGLLKSILVLKHGYIPPNLDFIKPKPSLKLYERNIKVSMTCVFELFALMCMLDPDRAYEASSATEWWPDARVSKLIWLRRH